MVGPHSTRNRSDLAFPRHKGMRESWQRAGATHVSQYTAPCNTVRGTYLLGPVARAGWNFPCGDWNKSPNSDMGEDWGFADQWIRTGPTWPDGSLPRGPGSTVSHSTQKSRACPTLCRIQVPGLSSGRLLRSTKASLLNFRGVLRHLLDVVSVSRNGPGKWSSRQYFAPERRC